MNDLQQLIEGFRLITHRHAPTATGVYSYAFLQQQVMANLSALAIDREVKQQGICPNY